MKSLAAIVATMRDDIGQEEVARTLRREILHLAWRLRAILRTHGDAAPSDLPSPATISLDPLRTALSGIATRIEGLQSEASSPRRVALVAERDGLADRKWLGLVKADVLAQIERLKAIEVIEKASKDTTTNKITTQSARIAQALVTNRLRGRFAIEVDKLGVAGLAIELQQAKTTAGVPFFQVRLINKPSEPVGKVLSEGEHRCVALAAFLAELSTIDAQSAIVFDDPVSSLDHLHRDRVAARLAEAGPTRQCHAARQGDRRDEGAPCQCENPSRTRRSGKMAARGDVLPGPASHHLGTRRRGGYRAGDPSPLAQGRHDGSHQTHCPYGRGLHRDARSVRTLFRAASQSAWRDQSAAARTFRHRSRDRRAGKMDRRHPDPSGEGCMMMLYHATLPHVGGDGRW